MPQGFEFQQEIVDTYLRGQTATTISTVYKALYQSATADVASGTITCSAGNSNIIWDYE